MPSPTRKGSSRSVDERFRRSGVRVFALDVGGTIERLRERTRAAVRDRPEIEEVRLFGSLARGDARPGSDADLLIVVRDSGLPFLGRVEEYSRDGVGVGIGCDVLVYTREELARLAEERNAFVRRATTEGIVLATR